MVGETVKGYSFYENETLGYGTYPVFSLFLHDAMFIITASKKYGPYLC